MLLRRITSSTVTIPRSSRNLVICSRLEADTMEIEHPHKESEKMETRDYLLRPQNKRVLHIKYRNPAISEERYYAELLWLPSGPCRATCSGSLPS